MGLHSAVVAILLVILLSTVVLVVYYAILRFLLWIYSELKNEPDGISSPDGFDRTDIPREVILAIAGAVAFASINPVILPVIYDYQVGSGLVENPQPEMTSEKSGLPIGKTPVGVFGQPKKKNDSIYRLEIKNHYQRNIEDIGILISFPGCVKGSSAFAFSPLEQIFDPSSFNHRVEFIEKDGLGRGLGDTTSIFRIDHLPPDKNVTIGYLVNESRLFCEININPPGSEMPEKTKFAVDYTWTYRGQSYAYTYNGSCNNGSCNMSRIE